MTNQFSPEAQRQYDELTYILRTALCDGDADDAIGCLDALLSTCQEQVASEIDAAADRIVGHAEPAMRGRCPGLRAGARIARGETYDQKVERLRMDGARELSRRHAARGEQQ